MYSFEELVQKEYDKRRADGCACANWHQAAGLIFEEVDEFWDEVKKRPGKRNKLNALKELIQISGLCRRAAEDLGLLTYYNEMIQKDPYLYPCLSP